MNDTLWLVLALVAVVLFGRYVLALVRRFLPLMVLVVLAALILPQCSGSEINF
jgi:cell division protein FtsW (lipid II flippase)